MCGFIGWFQRAGEISVERRSQLSAGLKLIAHRGPDDGQESSGANWFMGFRRLAILDLSEAGRQPMPFENERYRMTFNGEIYNFQELRAQRSHLTFYSTGDSEVLGRMLSHEPLPSVLNELRGMFAFAWWDTITEELIAARDHFGIKPLYYCLRKDGSLILSSEIKVIKSLLGGKAKVSKRALAQFFKWGSVQAPETMFEGVKSLPPGHLLRWKNGELKVERYFTPEWPAKTECLQGETAKKLTRNVIAESVKTHLVSDVPVGVFLSGGLDSTLMTALMREHGMQNIQAFSIGYEQNAGVPDESDTAARTAKFYGCEFQREQLSAQSLFDKLDPYFASLDQPTGDALNTWLVSRLAAQEVKVTLSGLGADEWFGGYNYHRILQLAKTFPLVGSGLDKATAPLVKAMHQVLPDGLKGHKLWKTILYASGAAGHDTAEMQAYARTIFDSDEISALLGTETSTVNAATDRASLVEDLPQRAPDSWLNELLLLETETYLANTLLRDNDATSMAHSLELRVPLVDRKVFELAGKIAPTEKLNLSRGKRVIREAFKDVLPDWINHDIQKKTFTLPLMRWMRTPAWKARIIDTLQSERCKNRGWLVPHEVERHLDRYYNATIDDKRGWKLSQTVWLMFVLESWAIRNVD